MQKKQRDERLCRDCGTQLIEKATKRTPEQLKKSYYYTGYYYCPACRKMYHNEKFKVMNENVDLFTRHSSTPDTFDIEIWTDGACSRNGMPNAKAAWAFVAGKYESSDLVVGKQTNNTAEGLAIYFALQWAAEKGYKNIRVHSDSQISLNNLQKKPEMVKENREIFFKIHSVIQENGLSVFYKKVLGHSGDVNNERADKLANGLVGIK